MAILPITQYGDEILDKKTVPVNKIDHKIVELISDMFDTMGHADGIGIAANQVGSNKSIFVIDVSEVKGYEHLKKLICINPKIVFRSPEKIPMEEGCLSLPGIRSEVIRPKSIKIDYKNLEMKPQTLEADELVARVIQHEYDHLQGTYFTDRVTDEKKKEIKELLLKVKNREMNPDYPITPKQKNKK